MRAAVVGALAGAVAASGDLGAIWNGCKFDFGNSTFDLSPLTSGIYYRVNDASNNAWSRNYTYYFNICANVDPTILPGRAATYCNNTLPGQWNPNPSKGITGPASAFQFNNMPAPDADVCHRLGGPVSASAMSYGLYDPTNPSRGVALSYTGGDSCPAYRGQPSRPRSLKLWILCDTDAYNIPDEEPVEETGNCAYEIFFKSAYGCPAQCPVVDRQLCSAHGICEFDTAIGNSRCFCNDGWTGVDCGSAVASSSGLSPVGGVLIAVGIFLAMTLGFLVYLWLRIRSLRLDPTAYSSLRAGPDDHADNTVQ